MQHRRKGKTSPPPTSSCLINCPFSVSAYIQKKTGNWKFSVSNPHHNHPASEASGHTFNQKITASLYNQMKKLGDTGLKLELAPVKPGTRLYPGTHDFFG
jgi:hypothetical protein